MGNDIQKFGQVEICGILLNGIDVSVDSISIRLNTAQGPIIGVCDADCCSETWIENIETPALGFPCTVIAAHELEMPEGRYSIDGEPQDFIRFYGLKLITNKGEIVIDYRNASNGYYGGTLDWNGERFYGGVFGQNNPNQEWIPVDEWLAQKSMRISRD